MLIRIPFCCIYSFFFLNYFFFKVSRVADGWYVDGIIGLDGQNLRRSEIQSYMHRIKCWTDSDLDSAKLWTEFGPNGTSTPSQQQYCWKATNHSLSCTKYKLLSFPDIYMIITTMQNSSEYLISTYVVRYTILL